MTFEGHCIKQGKCGLKVGPLKPIPKRVSSKISNKHFFLNKDMNVWKCPILEYQFQWIIYMQYFVKEAFVQKFEQI